MGLGDDISFEGIASIPRIEPLTPIDDIKPVALPSPIAGLDGAADLPLLLAGPIVRRAETSGIWIWLATSQAVTRVQPYLHPFDKNGNPHPRHAPGGAFVLADLGPDTFRCVRVGERLWVSLFRITPKQGKFPTDVILGYTFSITTASGQTHLEKLVDNLTRDLCYRPFPLPTLFLQSHEGHIAQASCRRPGAAGGDAFSDFDSWIRNWCESPKRRPAAFFLSGDQIYADDVAYALFESVRRLAPDVMGYDDYLPDVPYLGVTRDLAGPGLIKYTSSANEKETRKPVVNGAGFTTDDGQGHLMSFGEFAAMYLLVWNPVLCQNYKVEQNYGIAAAETENLRNFTKRVAEARRVLANIPTYMSFDDHEITDDWNLDDEWVDGTVNALARRVLTNGLAACWLFQAWGNEPRLTGSGAVVQTTRLIEKRLEAQRKVQGLAIDQAFETSMLTREPWAYVAPTKPPVIVTDLRTHRAFGAFMLNTSLLNEKGFAHLTSICQALPSGRPAVLLTGTPLLPWLPVMGLRGSSLGFDMWLDTVSEPPMELRKKYEFGDMWHDHPRGLVDFVQWVRETLKPSYCVVFSGDVHHGFVVKGKARLQVSEQDKRELWSLDIVQITSSPMKNENSDLRDTIKGISVSRILDTALPTDGTFESETTDQSWMKIAYDAVKLDGRLATGGVRYIRGKGTIIFRNHVCVVDFTDPKRVVSNFFGYGMTCSGVVTVPG